MFGYSVRNTRNLLRSAMERISAAGEGVLLYLKRESNALASDFEGGRPARRATTRVNAPEADFRDYGIGAQILRDVGVRKMIIMSDATPRLANLPGYGLEVVGSVPLSTNGKQNAAAK